MRHIFKFLFVFLFLSSCSSTSKVTETNKTVENKKEILNYAPENLFDLITPNSTIQKMKNLFGEPKVLIDNLYLYDLKNCYMMIETKDHIGISVISIQSKKIEPFVKIGKQCPLNIDKEFFQIGKTSFLDTFSSTESLTTEISRDKCNEFALNYRLNDNFCYNNSFVYGSFIPYGELNYQMLIFDDTYFQSSLGKGFVTKGFIELPSDSIIDFFYIGDEEVIKKSHRYGEGIHCSYLYYK